MSGEVVLKEEFILLSFALRIGAPKSLQFPDHVVTIPKGSGFPDDIGSIPAGNGDDRSTPHSCRYGGLRSQTAADNSSWPTGVRGKEEKLNLPVLKQLNDRITPRCRIDTLNPDESLAYIECRNLNFFFIASFPEKPWPASPNGIQATRATERLEGTGSVQPGPQTVESETRGTCENSAPNGNRSR